MKSFLHTMDSPLGPLSLVTGGEGEVRALGFSQSRLRRTLDVVDAPMPAEIESKLRSYLAGQLNALDDVSVATTGSDLQRQVWAALREIPVGQVSSYEDIARRLGYEDPRMAREVGAANASNPVAIIVPCHRVVGKNGDLKGYAWGRERKRWLLAHEGADLGDRSTHRLPGL